MKNMSDRRNTSPSGERDGVAIIGMSCLFPGARDVDAYWQNILNKVDAVSGPPPEAWDPDIYYDQAFSDPDKVYCQRGGYLGSLVSFDPLAYGIPPMSVGGEPDQWLALKLAYDAMADAGCTDLPEDVRHRTAIVLGKGTYLNGGNATAIQRTMVVGQTLELVKKLNPEFGDDKIELLRQEMKRVLPPIGPETVPGLIPNIIVGRIANRLDLMGPSYTVDAACASSLVAVQLAMRDLLNGECDLALAGGSQVWMPIAALNVFCQLGALSRDQQIRPFDKDANGTLLGEGIGMIVLKRLADAKRDGDRIYSVLRGVGVASDGRGVSVMAPRIDGEVLALRRAYEDAGVSPDTIGLIEAHGTATSVGDVVEAQALTRVFGQREAGLPRCALGTVKSMISHTIPASGVAGLIKLSLALHHKVLPPTLHVTEPNPKLELEKSHFYLNTETRPWIHGGPAPRRAGINAFGFGGINAHAILEEYLPDSPARLPDVGHLPPWDSEVVILDAAGPADLLARVQHVSTILADAQDGARDEPALADVAYTLNLERSEPRGGARVAVVATSIADLRAKLERVAKRLEDPACKQIKDVSGIYYFSEPVGLAGKVALLFPGEGAQYPGMFADLCLHFPEVREVFDRYDRMFFGHPRGDLPSDYIFPRPAFTDADRRRAENRLMQMDLAIEAVQAANQAMLALLRNLDLPADVCVGHSSGEYAAAYAAGVFDVDDDDRFMALGRALYQYYSDAESHDDVPRAVLLAIGASRDRVEEVAREAGGDIYLAVDNCPHQAILIGEQAAAERAIAIIKRDGLIFEQLAYDRAVHTPLFAPYAADLQRLYEQAPIREARIPLYSCATAGPYPAEPGAIRELFLDHWSRPVEFQRTIDALYEDGARVFVEVGPRGNLSAFVEDILRGRPACVVPANVMRRSGITQLNHLIGLLVAHGVSLNLDHLYARRLPRQINWHEPEGVARRSSPMPLSSSWPMLRLSEAVVEQVRAMPAHVTTEPQKASADPLTDSAPAEVHVIPPPRDEAPSFPEDSSLVSVDEPVFGVAPLLPAEDVEGVLAAHLGIMDRFLISQQEIMEAYLRGVGSTEDDSAIWCCDDSAHGSTGDYPLLGTVVTCEPGKRLVAERVYDLDYDRYLRDHTLGRTVSTTDDSLVALAIMPLTMSLEILAEAASYLCPGKIVVGMRDVYASQWLAWEDEPLTLQVAASQLDGGLVHVELRNLTAGAVAPTPIVDAVVVLADEYPTSDGRRISGPTEARPSRWTSDRLYADVMFHGPAWQGVKAIESTGRDGIIARLERLPADRFFDDAMVPNFVLDPVALDAAGQVIGFWTTEHLESASVIFPFRLKALDIFSAPPPVGAPIGCAAAIGLLGDQLVRSDIELCLADGTPWMRLTGWEDKRFDVPSHLHALILTREDATVSTDWPDGAASYAGSDWLACRAVETTISSDHAFWKRVWARRVLGRTERELFAALRLPDNRQLEWLGGRTAAKEAVQTLLKRHFGLDLRPADIEIGIGDEGQPLVGGPWVSLVGEAPLVSISHTNGLAVALAMLPADGRRAGIDIERVRNRPEGYAEIAFDDAERSLIASAPSDAEWMLRGWCAKEAVGKSLGTGLRDGPRSLAVVGIDRASGRLEIERRGRLENHDMARSMRFIADTALHGDLVSAVTVG